MNFRSLLLWPLFFLVAAKVPAQEVNAATQQLAKEVWLASGGENWSGVKQLRFTFIVEEGGKELARAEHEWNVTAGTDRVRWKGKDVTVNIYEPAADGDAKAAYARWVNDAYWLLAPLKIMDAGVTMVAEGEKEKDGAKYQTLRLSFAAVGLTPSDQYLLYIDPQTKLVKAWDYIPTPDKVVHGTWEKYERFGGLNLSTTHNFGGKVIRFTDITVQ